VTAAVTPSQFDAMTDEESDKMIQTSAASCTARLDAPSASTQTTPGKETRPTAPASNEGPAPTAPDAKTPVDTTETDDPAPQGTDTDTDTATETDPPPSAGIQASVEVIGSPMTAGFDGGSVALVTVRDEAGDLLDSSVSLKLSPFALSGPCRFTAERLAGSLIAVKGTVIDGLFFGNDREARCDAWLQVQRLDTSEFDSVDFVVVAQRL
jgi:hypothetical protein